MNARRGGNVLGSLETLGAVELLPKGEAREEVLDSLFGGLEGLFFPFQQMSEPCCSEENARKSNLDEVGPFHS